MGNYFVINKEKDSIIQVIKEAKKFINLVTFQFTSRRLAMLLKEKAEKGINVKVITLPIDSFAKVEERKIVDDLYEELREVGVELSVCQWEVGDASLTTTSLSGEQAEGGGRKWYSLHGKFIVTDKAALVMSTNFTDTEEWEVYCLMNEEQKIKMFVNKFDKLHKLFISKQKGKIPGSLFELLDHEDKEEIIRSYRTVKRINVKQYSPEITNQVKKEGLIICPFEGRARNMLYQLISDAEKFIYLSSERFFDDELTKVILQKAYSTKMDIKIVANPPSFIRQNPVKAESDILKLVAVGVKYSSLKGTHAKFWVTDKQVAIGSVNLSQMNLGIKKPGDYVRANTEILYIDDNINFISEAKAQFEKLFAEGEDIINTPRNERESFAKEVFDLFGIRSRPSARKALSKFQMQFELNTTRELLEIARFAVELAKSEKSSILEEEHILMSGILFHLQQRKHDFKELISKLQKITTVDKIKECVEGLLRKRYIKKQDEFYVINIKRLI